MLIEGLLEDTLAVFLEELAVSFGGFGFVWRGQGSGWGSGCGGFVWAIGLGRGLVFAGEGFVGRIGWGLAGGL